MKRIAALDVGDRRIGFAVADPTATIVSHTGTLVRADDVESDLAAIADLLREYSVEKLVVGRPVHLSGQAGAQAHKIKGAAANIGGEALRKIAYEAEKAGKSEDMDSLADFISEVERQFTILKENMEEELDSSL